MRNLTPTIGFITGLMFGISTISTTVVHADSCTSVKREMAFGQAATEDAKDKAGFKRAAEEFNKAAQKAPNCAAAYFNLGVVQEKAGDLVAAKAAFERYLELAPRASDSDSVQQQIFKLEYRITRAKETEPETPVEKRDAEERSRHEEARPMRLAGDWCLLKKDGSIDCGDYAKVEVVGSTIMVTYLRSDENRLRGNLQGNKISGFHYHSRLPMREGACPSIRTPMTGIISNDGQRIELSYPLPQSWTCMKTGQIQNLKTKSVKTILVRKKW